MGCTQRELHSPVRIMVCTSPLYALSVIQKYEQLVLSLNGQNLWTTIRHQDRMLELTNVASILACENVIRFQESNADQFLDQGSPFALP